MFYKYLQFCLLTHTHVNDVTDTYAHSLPRVTQTHAYQCFSAIVRETQDPVSSLHRMYLGGEYAVVYVCVCVSIWRLIKVIPLIIFTWSSSPSITIYSKLHSSITYRINGLTGKARQQRIPCEHSFLGV